jgi:hypothetical protein
LTLRYGLHHLRFRADLIKITSTILNHLADHYWPFLSAVLLARLSFPRSPLHEHDSFCNGVLGITTWCVNRPFSSVDCGRHPDTIEARGHRGYGWMDPSKSCWVFMAFEMGRISCKHLLRLGNTLSWLDVSDRAQSTAGKGIASWPLAGRMRTPCDVGLAIKYCDERYGHGHMKGQGGLHTIEYIFQPEVLIACCLVGVMVIELSCTS